MHANIHLSQGRGIINHQLQTARTAMASTRAYNLLEKQMRLTHSRNRLMVFAS